MDDRFKQNFVGLRTALKICSFFVLLYAFLDLHRSFTVLQNSQEIWEQMMNGKPIPAMANLSDFYFRNFIFIAVFFLAVMVACFFVTKRSQGGEFLYVNLGLFVLLGIIKQNVLYASVKMASAPMEMLMAP